MCRIRLLHYLGNCKWNSLCSVANKKCSLKSHDARKTVEKAADDDLGGHFLKELLPRVEMIN